jgi:hypothetical protein
MLDRMLVPMRVLVPKGVADRFTAGPRKDHASVVGSARNTAGRDVRKQGRDHEPDDHSIVPEGFQQNTSS